MREDKIVKDDLIEPSRRQFLQLGAMATAAFQLEHSALASKAKTMINVPFAATKDPRLGFIGVGGRGRGCLVGSWRRMRKWLRFAT